MADFALMQETMSAVRLGEKSGHSTVPRSFSPAPYNDRSPWSSPNSPNGATLYTRDIHIDLSTKSGKKSKGIGLGATFGLGSSGEGMVVMTVAANGPASKLLAVGDVVVSMNGEDVTNLPNKLAVDAVVTAHSHKPVVDLVVAQAVKMRNKAPGSGGGRHDQVRDVNHHRSVKQQRRLSLSSMVNEQVRDMPEHTTHYDNVDIHRSTTQQQEVSKMRRVSQEFRGEHVGQHTGFGDQSMVHHKHVADQDNFDSHVRVNEQMVGGGGRRHSMDASAVNVANNLASQAHTHKARRVSEQIRGETAGQQTLYDGEGRDVLRVGAAQKMVQDDQRINDQVRSHHAHAYGHAGVNQMTVAKAQGHASKQRRVSEQIRGETAGQATLFDNSAREYKRHTGNHTEISNYLRVNQQVKSVGVGQLPHDHIPNRRASIGQLQVADVRMVNEQVRGEHAGQTTLLGMDGAQLSTEAHAQRRVSVDRRVNNEFRGEHVGTSAAGHHRLDLKTGPGGMPVFEQKPQTQRVLVNEQNRVGGARGNIPHDAMENRRASIGQDLVADVRMVNEMLKGEHAGKSTQFKMDSTELATKASAQKRISKQVRVGNEARGELAGQRTSVGFDSQSVVLAHTAPKSVRVNDAYRMQTRTPGPDGADARHIDKLQNWDAEGGELEEIVTGFGAWGDSESEEEEDVDPKESLRLLQKVYKSAETACKNKTPMTFTPHQRLLTAEQLRAKVSAKDVFLAIGTMWTFKNPNTPMNVNEMFTELILDADDKCTLNHMLSTFEPMEVCQEAVAAKKAAYAAGFGNSVAATQLAALHAGKQTIIRRSKVSKDGMEEAKALGRTALAKFKAGEVGGNGSSKK